MAIKFVFLPFKGTFEFALVQAAAVVVTLARLAQNDDYRVDQADNFLISQDQ